VPARWGRLAPPPLIANHHAPFGFLGTLAYLRKSTRAGPGSRWTKVTLWNAFRQLNWSRASHLAYREAFAVRRSVEKADGFRCPTSGDVAALDRTEWIKDADEAGTRVPSLRDRRLIRFSDAGVQSRASAEFHEWVGRVVAPFHGEVPLTESELAWLRRVHERVGPVDDERLHRLRIAARFDAAQAAVALLSADTARTLPTPLRLDVAVVNGMAHLLCEGSSDPDAMSGVWGLTMADVLEECAESVQSYLAFDWQLSWPECPDHDRPLGPQVADGALVWQCDRHHVVARIGELGLPGRVVG
jgi:hypothetical protein